MGASDGPEAAKNAALATLKSYLPGQLSAIATARPDAYNPPAPATAAYYADWQFLLPSYPAIMVCYNGSRLVNDGSTVWHGLAHQLDVVGALQSNQINALAIQGQRLLLAIEQVFGKHQNLDGSLSDCLGVALKRCGVATEAPQKGKGALFTHFVAWQLEVLTNELL